MNFSKILSSIPRSIQTGLCFLVFCSHLIATDTFQWPQEAKAAVCLTYDDGLDGHIDVAKPQLDRFGFKGSFYCTGASDSLKNRLEDWRKLVEDGHELGNHSLFHPCLKDREGRESFDWVVPEYDLANYTLPQIRSELEVANSLLMAVDGNKKRTYAYTCSDYWVGEREYYVEAIQPLFSGARCDGPLLKSMKDANIYFMPSWMVVDPTGQEMIDYVKQATKSGTVATFMFHSVGGGYLNVSSEAHTELLRFLSENKDTYWVPTFMELTDHIQSEQNRLGWSQKEPWKR